MIPYITILLHDPPVKKITFFFGLVLVIYLTVGIYFWNKLQPQIPLYYSLPRGEEQLASPFSILFLPFFSIICFSINFLIAGIVFSREKVAAYVLIISGFSLSILLLIPFIKIILITV